MPNATDIAIDGLGFTGFGSAGAASAGIINAGQDNTYSRVLLHNNKALTNFAFMFFANGASGITVAEYSGPEFSDRFSA